MDIWSLGCCLAELFSGQILFNGATEMEIIFKIFSCRGGFGQLDPAFKATMPNFINMEGAPQDIGHLLGAHPDLPDLYALLDRCLQMDPKERPSIEEVKQSAFF